MRNLLGKSRILFLIMMIGLATNSLAGGLGVTPADQFSTLPGFEVELLYEVPSETQGSWVSLTVDPKGRLIACDQYGGLYRIDVSGEKPQVKKLDIDFTGAQGLLCAFGALYANVNHKGGISGLWRLTDTDGDDQYDNKEHILPLNGGSEHGPHALILTPDKSRILMCAGNNTDLPSPIARSRVPKTWDEDHLLGRMPDARGHNASRMGPGGFILSVNPDGKDIELIATGFRNEYDIALNRQGELFTYDADMEWDVGTPWYRPTRINHVISGAEFGWRNGTGKWPEYYPDSFGSAVDIGPGSPTGICFGYGTKFPKKYQDALFICDWSYGNIHAVHLTPDGSSYSGTYETFATAAPLPVTDLAVHPDGMLYFTIGGRRTQSGLYRIRYTGKQDDSPDVDADKQFAKMRDTRRQLEKLHVQPDAGQLSLIMENLGSADRGIRFAARIALEHLPVDSWRKQVLELDNPQARILGVVALARNGKPTDKNLAIDALTSLNWDSLSAGQRTDLLRAYGLLAIRLGKIARAESGPILTQLNDAFPSGENRVDRELAQVLVYLEAPGAVGRVVKEMRRSPSQENQIHYAMTLRDATKGWSPPLYRDYFGWFREIQSARGGMSFGGFIENIRKQALGRVPKQIQRSLADVLRPPKQTGKSVEEKPRKLVQQWKVDDLLAAVTDDAHVADFEKGKEVFAAAQCYKCHRMGVQGGILGPDLTGAGGRFSHKDLLVSIIEPNKVISDQYAATQFLIDDGTVVVGRIVNMNGNQLKVMTNMLDPSSQVVIRRDTVEQAVAAKNSMMPANLLDTFTKQEVADLITYLRAGGRNSHPIYKKTVATK